MNLPVGGGRNAFERANVHRSIPGVSNCIELRKHRISIYIYLEMPHMLTIVPRHGMLKRVGKVQPELINTTRNRDVILESGRSMRGTRHPLTQLAEEFR